jgi:hypothetical protein
MKPLKYIKANTEYLTGITLIDDGPAFIHEVNDELREHTDQRLVRVAYEDIPTILKRGIAYIHVKDYEVGGCKKVMMADYFIISSEDL